MDAQRMTSSFAEALTRNEQDHVLRLMELKSAVEEFTALHSEQKAALVDLSSHMLEIAQREASKAMSPFVDELKEHTGELLASLLRKQSSISQRQAVALRGQFQSVYTNLRGVALEVESFQSILSQAIQDNLVKLSHAKDTTIDLQRSISTASSKLDEHVDRQLNKSQSAFEELTIAQEIIHQAAAMLNQSMNSAQATRPVWREATYRLVERLLGSEDRMGILMANSAAHPLSKHPVVVIACLSADRTSSWTNHAAPSVGGRSCFTADMDASEERDLCGRPMGTMGHREFQSLLH